MHSQGMGALLALSLRYQEVVCYDNHRVGIMPCTACPALGAPLSTLPHLVRLPLPQGLRSSALAPFGLGLGHAYDL